MTWIKWLKRCVIKQEIERISPWWWLKHVADLEKGWTSNQQSREDATPLIPFPWNRDHRLWNDCRSQHLSKTHCWYGRESYGRSRIQRASRQACQSPSFGIDQETWWRGCLTGSKSEDESASNYAWEGCQEMQGQNCRRMWRGWGGGYGDGVGSGRRILFAIRNVNWLVES